MGERYPETKMLLLLTDIIMLIAQLLQVKVEFFLSK